MNGAAVCIQCLLEEKTSYIFGYPGAAIAPFYDALRSFDAADGSPPVPGESIRHVLVRNEQNAGHAASGYARASATVGVCVATSGPGALNLMPALATAYMDSIPVVAITGQVSTELIGRDVFQEADITGACEPFTKYSYLVKDVNDLPRIFKEAFHIASTGRPGPVLIDLPLDVQQADYPLPFEYPQTVSIRGYKPRMLGHPLQIKRAVSEIVAAKKPLICAGGGVVSAGARKELIRFAEKLDVPVVSTLMGVGTMPSDHPLYLGMLGTHGRRAANIAVAKADLMILCGARVGDRSLASPDQTASHARIIHIDIDTVEIGKNMPADVPIVGDVKEVLSALYYESEPLRHNEWRTQYSQWRDAEPDHPLPKDGYVQPGRFMRELSHMTGDRGKVIIVADVGQNQMWAANSFDFDGGRFLTSGGMGTMGYSIPAAIGAKLAKPDRQVIVVCGDGSFMMMLPELSTLVQERLPVKIIVMRNGVLGMVREIQKRRCGGRYFGVALDGCPDTVTLAAAYGMKASVLSDGSETAMRQAIEQLLSESGAAILECVVDPDAASLR